jgi:hypothetical protein
MSRIQTRMPVALKGNCLAGLGCPVRQAFQPDPLPRQLESPMYEEESCRPR